MRVASSERGPSERGSSDGGRVLPASGGRLRGAHPRKTPPPQQQHLRTPQSAMFALRTAFRALPRLAAPSAAPMMSPSMLRMPTVASLAPVVAPLARRWATFGQVIRGCRKKQRARKPVSPALSEGKRPCMKGVCLRVTITKPKKPNSAERKIARVKLSSDRVITAYIPGEGASWRRARRRRVAADVRRPQRAAAFRRARQRRQGPGLSRCQIPSDSRRYGSGESMRVCKACAGLTRRRAVCRTESRRGPSTAPRRPRSKCAFVIRGLITVSKQCTLLLANRPFRARRPKKRRPQLTGPAGRARTLSSPRSAHS